MKKILLLFASVIVIAGSYAQSLQFVSYTISVTGDKDSTLHGTAVIKNISNVPVVVRVDRTNENLSSGHYSYFCWGGQCYSPPTSTSPFTTTLNPGDSSIAGPSGFIAYLAPAGFTGSSDISYSFYNDSNLADSVGITFNYSAIATGIRELVASGVALTTPSPNPANATTTIGFNLAPGKSSKLVIYNMLGSVVREIKLNDKMKMMMLSTTDLKNGMYIYSLVTDNRVVASKKLLVNNR
jgi:hypothetical protein